MTPISPLESRTNRNPIAKSRGTPILLLFDRVKLILLHVNLLLVLIIGAR